MTPEELVSDIGSLISLPRAYHRINEMLDDPRYGTADIGKVIAHDPALTARLLRMVNSAYYNFPSKIDTIPMAINVLGTRALRDLVLATSVASAFANISTHLVDVADFWHHSIYCGILSRLLGKRFQQERYEQLFVAGLLHDLGKLVIYLRLPDQAALILTRFARSDRPLYLLEQEELGFDHSQVGAALLRGWELPELFVEVAACHHALELSAAYRTEACLVHVANALTKKVEPGHKVKLDFGEVPPLHAIATERLSITAELVDELRLEADVQSIEVFSTLFSGTALAS